MSKNNNILFSQKVMRDKDLETSLHFLIKGKGESYQKK